MNHGQAPHYQPRNEKELPPDYYTSTNPEHGWDFIVCNSSLLHKLTVFVSSDSVGKYKSFKDNMNAGPLSPINDLQAQGLGVPLLRAETHSFSINKFLTIYRFHTDNAIRGFNKNTDYGAAPFCEIKKSRHWAYDTYTLTFKPKNSRPFKVWLFAHSTLPISDYQYNGIRYRWIHDRKYFQYYESYRAFRLEPNQPTMLSNWSGGDFLDSRKNPLVGNKLSQFIDPRSRKPKDKYFSDHEVGRLDKLKKKGILGRLQETTKILLPDMSNSGYRNVNYDSIHSVTIDVLVHLCTGLVLKRIEDIKEEKRRSNNAAAMSSM